jgi:hypothetical protein
VTNTEISTQLDCLLGQLASAVEERNPERLSQVLEVQKKFVAAHVDLLDDTRRKQIQSAIEHSLLLAKASRAHCLEAIRANQRKLSVLAAYQAG